MKTFNRPIRAAAISLGLAVLSSAHSAELKLPDDGWVSWQVAAVDNAPAWCCWNSWRDKNASPVACRLDRHQDGFSTRDKAETTDAIRVYARMTRGKLERLHALSASCPVETETPISALENVPADDSARWLITLARQSGGNSGANRPMEESALAGLAMHRGDLALNALADFARNDSRYETRKRAVFWLAILRGNQGADITSSVMFGDKVADMREHAAFALSQSKSPRVAPDLIRLGNTDKAGEVRAKAWFWLAHEGAPESEQAIAAALRKDGDDKVREQAIFALSQLPGDRATRALIAIAEDRTLTVQQRKRAVFWLSQSETDSAQAYLEKVLARNTAER